MMLVEKFLGKNLRLTGSIILVWFLAACTTVYEPPPNITTNYQAVEKIPLSVELRLTDELRAAQWKKEMMGSTVIIPLGNLFSEHAEIMSKKLFAKVVVTRDVSGGKLSGIDAVITPKAVSIQRTMGATAFGDSYLTVLLEWAVEDPKGRLLWVDTIKGQGKANSGNVFTHRSNASDQIEALIKDLFGKSYEALSRSPEVRSFARERGK